jgi:SAM-dependent methyltransferase
MVLALDRTHLEDRKSLWASGIKDEIAFWWEILRHVEGFEAYIDILQSNLDPSAALKPLIVDTRQSCQPLRVLDVGSGPVPSCGYKMTNREVEITAIDSCAAVYSDIMETEKIKPPVATRQCDAERMDAFLLDQEFDVISFQSSLDRTYDPIRALKAAANLVAAGGNIVISGRVNDGQASSYFSTHLWNIDITGEGPRLWHRGGSRLLCECLPAEYTWTWGEADNHFWARAVKPEC